jgi:hypothetical protein
MQCIHIELTKDKTLANLQDDYPAIFFSTELNKFAPMFQRIRNKDKDKVWKDVKVTFFTKCERMKERLPTEELNDSPLCILAAARLADVVPWKEPNIGEVSELCDLSRNTLSNFARMLRSLGLVEMKQKGRSELIRPTQLGDLYSDLFVGETHKAQSYLAEAKKKLESGSVDKQTIENLETVQAALGMTRNQFPKNSLNYETIDSVHDAMIELIASLRMNRRGEANGLIEEINESLAAMKESAKQGRTTGTKPLILEDTGEKVGSGRIFRPVRT